MNYRAKNDFVIVKKVIEEKTDILYVDEKKSELITGIILSSNDNNFKVDEKVIFLEEFGIKLEDNIYAVNNNYIIASI